MNPIFSTRGATISYFDLRMMPVRTRARHQASCVLLLRDVTDQKRAAAERDALAARVQEQQQRESLSVLAGGLAHDFNNLLAGIVGNADLLSLKLAPSSEMGTSVGAILLRTQGRSVWRRFNAAMSEGRVPNREVVDGVLVIFGGAFLITPGFVTDIFGFLLLIPPTRALIRRYVMKRIGRRVDRAATDARERRASRPRSRYDVEGTASEYDAPSPRLER